MSTRRERWYCCSLVHGKRRYSAVLRAWSADEAAAEFRAGLGTEWAKDEIVAVRDGAGPDPMATGPEDLGVQEGV